MLQPQYARTLDGWVTTPREHHDDAVDVASAEVYQRYIKYLTGSADHFRSGHIDVFRSGHIDVMQFTLAKTPPAASIDTVPGSPES